MSDSTPPAPPVPSGFFVLRTPLLPFGEVLAWSEGLEAPGASGDPADLAGALKRDRRLLRRRLGETAGRPSMQEALFLASPSLHERLALWRDEPESKKGQGVERALVRYLLRMAARPTPFGLFAGCSLGRVGERSSFVTGPAERYRRHTRLDMDYLCSLVQELERRPEIRESLTYRPNNSLYRIADRLRFAESRMRGGARTYHLVSVEVTDYLEACLQRARDGARADELARGLVEDDPEIETEEARQFIEELIDSQILISDLTPAVTGAEPIHGLVEESRRHDALAGVAGCLAGVEAELRDIDSSELGIEPDRYRSMAARLSELPTPVELSRLFQVDLVKPAPEATLGPEVMRELERAITLLPRLAYPSPRGALFRFVDAFNRRFEGREVPLVRVLDDETGIGFEVSDHPKAESAPLLDTIPLPQPEVPPSTPWEAYHLLLLDKLTEARAEGRREIVLEESELEGIWARDPDPVADAFDIAITLAAASPEAVESGDFRILVHGGAGPSGARFLGRFCHADPALHEKIVDHLRAEESLAPDAVFAEVVHLPEDRLGNVLLRPVLRGYEIPYLGRSGAPAERQIPVTDLMVSVRGQRIVLRSRRLGRQVIPRMSTAHNFVDRGLPLYRFLCMLQAQGTIPGLGWQWGPYEGASFLPRVRLGRLVLHRAVWNLRREEILELARKEKEGFERFQAAQALRVRKGMPRFVYLVEGDNQLLVDFDNVISVEALIELVKKRYQIALMEMYPGPEELAARGPEGSFVHEAVVPFVRAPEPAAGGESGDSGTERSGPVSVEPIPLDFPPGSEWLYAKLYCGPAVADRVLRELVQPVAERALASGAADGWFFIRYRDPDWHLRLRFHGAPERLLGELLPLLGRGTEPLLKDGLVARFQIDTYEREVARYGGPRGMPIAERLFHVDSEAVLALLEWTQGDEGADRRWRLALYGMDALLADLGLDFARRRRVIRECRESFGQEFRVEKGTRIQLGNRFRRERPRLESLLARSDEAQAELGPALEVLRARSERLVPIVEALREEERSGSLTLSMEQLASSLLHMFANRVLRSAHRAQELVLYDFLDRLYQSRAARQGRP